MRLISPVGRQFSAGFSLLEMVVALAILALSLGALYQATGGATRNASVDEEYAYGVELARSLLADNGKVPYSGANLSGETNGGFKWHVKSAPLQFGRTPSPEAPLHAIEVQVSWMDAGKQRAVVLNSVVEGHAP